MFKKVQNLRIGIISQTPAVAGAEQYMLSLMKEFTKERHIIYFATNNELFKKLANKFTKDTYTIPVILDIIGNIRGLIKSIIYLPYAIIFYSRLLRTYKKKGVNVILMSGFSEKMLVTFLSVFFRLPVVWIEYGRLTTIFKRNFYLPKVIYRFLNKIPKYVIIPTLNTKQSLITDAKTPLARLRLISCGIDFSTNQFANNKELKKKYKGKIVIGNVSRLTKEKGQQFIIEAAPRILEVFPNAAFLLVGEWWDKELAYFQELIKKHNLVGKIELLGFVDDVNPYYSLFDVFLFPTVWELEGFGLVSIEAIKHKVPVIASDIPPVNEIIINNKTGILVMSGDSNALADAVIVLLKDKKKQYFLVNNAYADARRKYDIKESGAKTIEVLYNSISK